MERFISACRNPLAKSATTKAIGYATQVPNASAKLLLFSDMAMGWSGLRAVLVRIACMCPHNWAKQEKKVEKKTQGVTEVT